MLSRATSLVGFCAIVLSAQTAPSPPSAAPQAVRPLRITQKKPTPAERPTICAIPLIEVRVDKFQDPMSKLAPPAGFDNIDRMPFVKLPAPPCQEEKR